MGELVQSDAVNRVREKELTEVHRFPAFMALPHRRR